MEYEPRCRICTLIEYAFQTNASAVRQPGRSSLLLRARSASWDRSSSHPLTTTPPMNESKKLSVTNDRGCTKHIAVLFQESSSSGRAHVDSLSRRMRPFIILVLSRHQAKQLIMASYPSVRRNSTSHRMPFSRCAAFILFYNCYFDGYVQSGKPTMVSTDVLVAIRSSRYSPYFH